MGDIITSIKDYESLDDKVAAIFYFMNLEQIPADFEAIHSAFYELKKKYKIISDIHFKLGGRFPISEDLEQTFPALMLCRIMYMDAPEYRFYIIGENGREIIKKNIIPQFSKDEIKELQEISKELKMRLKIRVKN
jgi:hypothetical protein